MMKISNKGILQPMIRYALFLFVFCCYSAYAKNIRVHVVQHDGKPFNNAIVTISGSSSEPHTTPPQRSVAVAQTDMKFNPHIAVAQVGQKVLFHNFDPISHHIYAITGPMNFSFIIRSGEKNIEKVFPRPGVVAMGCNIHDWMNGFIKVVDTPHFGITANNTGTSITIPDTLTHASVEVWHPQMNESLIVPLTNSDYMEIALNEPLQPVPELSTPQDIEFAGEQQ